MNSKKIKIFTLTSLMLLVSCGGPKVGVVQNITFEEGILSFDPVENAEGYYIKFTQDGELVYEDKITDTSIDTDSLGFEGKLNFEVCAYIGEKYGEVTTYTFTALSVFEDVIFEAEDYLANYGTGKAQCNYRNNPAASNGAYVGGIDDAGQGIYINYLCPFDGTFTFECTYATDEPVAHDDVWVNGVKQARYDFTEKTGWGGSTFITAKAEVEITLVKGWNSIAVYKNGDSSDNWGSFVELDYFTLKGNGEKYNSEELKEFGDEPPYYRLEAEMASPRKKNEGSGTFECKNPAIVDKGSNTFSNGFIMGGIEANYDGLEWQFHALQKGKYEVTIAYAAGQFDGSVKAAPSFIATQEEVGLTKNVDFLDCDIKTMQPLPYTNWDVITVAEEKVILDLEQGKNFIYCLKLDVANSGIFQVDYIDVKLVEAAE